MASFFAESFVKSANRAQKALQEYVESPEDADKVHNMRVALRRLEVSFSVMPKKHRKQNHKQIDACREFFRANSQVRDYDIIRHRIAAVAQTNVFEELISSLDKRRKVELKRALRFARLVGIMPLMNVDDIEDKELGPMYNKVLGRLIKNVAELLPDVIAHDKNKDELHELRKNLKKLRYVLEIIPAEYKKWAEKKISKIIRVVKSRGLVSRLKELQDLLGSIHDSDITIDYLAGIRKESATFCLAKEKGYRSALYRKFVKRIG